MNFTKGIQVVSILAVCISFITCSSTNPGMTTAGQEDQTLSQTEPSDEDQVLQLLGITTDSTGGPTLDSVMQEKEELDQRVKKLEADLDNKNAKISQLVQEIEEKNTLLTEREKLLADLQPTQPTSGSDNFENAYQAAYSSYMAKDYQVAINSFEQLIQQDMNHSLSDNCQYWIGESYYGLGEYQTALIEFEKVSNFINSNKEDAALLKIGLCYEKLSQNDSAKQTFQRILDKYPNSEFVSLAQQLLAKYQ